MWPIFDSFKTGIQSPPQMPPSNQAQMYNHVYQGGVPSTMGGSPQHHQMYQQNLGQQPPIQVKYICIRFRYRQFMQPNKVILTNCNY